MLITLVVWIYISFITYVLGAVFLRSGYKGRGVQKPVEFYMLTGLAVLMVLLNFVSLFVGMAWIANSLLFLFCVGYLSFNFSDIKKFTFVSGSKWFWASVLIFFVFALSQSIRTPFVTDTALYHAQTIQWFENYPAVKGLANIHGRFGFNSSYHLATALFSFTSFLGTPLHNALPSFLFFIFSVFCLRKIFAKDKRDFAIYFFSGILLLIMIFYRPWVSSPSPDYPTTVYVLLTLCLLMDWLQSRDAVVLKLILLFAFVLITIKVSSIAILTVPLLMIFWLEHTQRKRFFLYLTLVAALVLVPWLTRNAIISGYLIYPFPYIDIFSFQWKVPYDLVVTEKEWVKSFARTASYNWEWASKLPFQEWFKIWWQNKTFVEHTIFLVMLISPAIVLFRVRKSQISTILILLYLLSFAGVVFWFYMAPYFRFAHGFIISCFLVVTYMALYKFRRVMAISCCAVMLAFSAWSIYKELEGVSLLEHVLYPQPYEQVSVKQVQKPGFDLYLPEEGDLCHNHPLPCTPYEQEGLSLIGNKIGEGFYVDTKARPKK
ncbi:hypothetical protein RCC89_15875 [Cytophagaceae bacterium ABcell3]|nr:hypothetical protein RCC89_15875 [Cytophagaceae bacterium ABcell3]